ncbi:hypothetical protein [Dictyobacter arantiisoli]|uniref:hypothetical protein n=1 Tax=Dictyobacter arantiisoli TaxID=2014874 RepID=UPI0011EFF956|nr:hypothetical protein [Dictyobacter arantiisoli]
MSEVDVKGKTITLDAPSVYNDDGPIERGKALAAIIQGRSALFKFLANQGLDRLEWSNVERVAGSSSVRTRSRLWNPVDLTPYRDQ